VCRAGIVALKPQIRNEGLVSSSTDVTGLLRRWSAGDESARDRLIPLVYDGLRELAHRRLLGAPFESSLATTELVHEAYLRLVDARGVDFLGRVNFLALASEVMRNLLVDRVRARLAAKRGGSVKPAHLDDLDDYAWVAEENLETIADLDDALKRLAALKPRQGLLLQHRYFGGLTLEESAAAAGVSLATAKRELRLARAWLALELKGEPLS
jgi:RNA polymerase sigma factor (TIGR02999 family)